MIVKINKHNTIQDMITSSVCPVLTTNCMLVCPGIEMTIFCSVPKSDQNLDREQRVGLRVGRVKGYVTMTTSCIRVHLAGHSEERHPTLHRRH